LGNLEVVTRTKVPGLADLSDLVWPRRCVACGVANAAWCAACRGHPERLPIEIGDGVVVFAAGRYEGPRRSALLAYKERGRRELAQALAEQLTAVIRADDALARFRAQPLVLVPVPSSARARRARGGDHLIPVVRRAARSLGYPMVRALEFDRPVQDSAGLGIAARQRNLERAMFAAAPRGPSAALVVDDIVTTGATLREAVRALKEAGWTVAGGAVIAATALRHRGDR
jgi:predicted amidophosphoribosyltransferase